MDDAIIVRVEALTKTYDAQGGVNDVSFEVRRREIVGLLGPNGSGKSTTLHCLVGIVPPTSGRMQLGGFEHDEPAAKDVFGFLPDDLPLPDSLRLPEVLTLHRRLRPRFDEDFADQLVAMVGLADHGTKYVGQYSHGMKRKLQLVTALAHHPQLLVMDEPMRGLDPEAGVLVRTLLDVFVRKGGAVLLATHDLASAESNCHRVVVISSGSIVSHGAPKDLMRSSGAATLEEYFIRATGLEAGMENVLELVRAANFLDQPGFTLEEEISEHGRR